MRKKRPENERSAIAHRDKDRDGGGGPRQRPQIDTGKSVGVPASDLPRETRHGETRMGITETDEIDEFCAQPHDGDDGNAETESRDAQSTHDRRTPVKSRELRTHPDKRREIGRATCRDRVWQNV